MGAVEVGRVAGGAGADEAAEFRAASTIGCTVDREAGLSFDMASMTCPYPTAVMRTGRMAVADFLTSAFRSSRQERNELVKPERSSPATASSSLNRSSSHPRSSFRKRGLFASRGLSNVGTRYSSPPASAIADSVVIPPARILAFWSAKTCATEGAKFRPSFSPKGFPIPVAIRATMSSARIWMILLLSVIRAFKGVDRSAVYVRLTNQRPLA